jgi:hypothetical protein
MSLKITWNMNKSKAPGTQYARKGRSGSFSDVSMISFDNRAAAPDRINIQNILHPTVSGVGGEGV